MTMSAIGLPVAMLLLAAACGRSEGGSTPTGAARQSAATAPLGQVAGNPGSMAVMSTPNPYEGNPQAIQQGKHLFTKMNCAGCHGYKGQGNMGPDLTDTYWRYGGLPIQIYQSIRDGRPQGMPSWGVALPPDDIWKLVAYVQSFGGSVSVRDYEHARQGDQPGEQVAPELQTPIERKP